MAEQESPLLRIWSFVFHFWRFLLLWNSLIWLLLVLVFDCFGWLVLISMGQQNEILRIEPALFITLVVAVPPMLFSLNWLAALCSSLGLYGFSQSVLSASEKLWSLPFMPSGLGVPIAQVQSGDYYREKGDLEEARKRYEQGVSNYQDSAWRYFSGACYGLVNYSRMLAKQGQKEDAQAIRKVSGIPICSYLLWSAFRIYCCLLIPMILCNLVLVLFEDINGRQLDPRKLADEVDLGKFEKQSLNYRISRLLPAVAAAEWLYTPEGKIVVCGGLANTYIETVKAQTGESKETILVQRRPPEFSKDNYRIAKMLLERAKSYFPKCSSPVKKYFYVDECLDRCNQHLESLGKVSSGLLVHAISLQEDFQKHSLVKSQNIDFRKELNDKSMELLLDEVRDSSKSHGGNHPFTIEREMNLALLQAQNGIKNSSVHAITASRHWTSFTNRLLEEQPTKLSAEFFGIEQFGDERLKVWTFESGMILAYILDAERLDQEVLAMCQTLRKLCVAGNRPTNLQVEQLLELSSLYSKCIQYSRARELIREAESIGGKLKNNFKSEKTILRCRLAEARLCLDQEDYSRAKEISQSVIDGFAKLGDDESELLADSLECLAKAQSMFPRNINEAVDNEKKALRIRQRLVGQRSPTSLRSMIRLLHLLCIKLEQMDSDQERWKNFPDAKVLTTKLAKDMVALQTGKAAREDFSIMEADAYFEIGNLYKALKKFDMARMYYGRACDIHMFRPEASAIKATVLDMDAMAGLDVLDEKSKSKGMNRWMEGVKSARLRVLWASDLLSNYVTEVLPQLSLAEQIALNYTIETQMNCILATLAVCEDDKNIPYLYAHLLAWKGFLLNQLSLRSQVLNSTEDKQMSDLLQRHQQSSERILQAYMDPNSTEEQFRSLTENKEALERQINEYTRKRFRADARLALEPRELQAKLAADEVLVDLYEFGAFNDNKPHYGAVVVSSHDFKFIDFGKAAGINKSIQDWRSSLRSVLPGSKGSPERPVEKESAAGTSREEREHNDRSDSWLRLQESLCNPISRALPKSVKHLWVVDESELARLPWSVLISESKEMSEIEVCQIDSPKELVSLKSSQVREDGNSRRAILLVGGIDYSGREHSLPGAAREIELIEEQAKDLRLKATILSDTIANSYAVASQKNVLKQLSLCGYAHFATHGYFRDASASGAPGGERSSTLLAPSRSSGLLASVGSSRNPLIDSGLLVSNDKSDGGAKGFLTAEDLLTADLRKCRLVTLSACETGRGRELTGQGVIGLRSALMGAGARTVLLSLWKVPDLATTELMKVFYRSILEGETPVHALKKAQAEVRSHEKWKAPKYWAAWVLIGDGWRAVAAEKPN